MGPSAVEQEHGWILTTILAEADGSVALRVTPTRNPCRVRVVGCSAVDGTAGTP
jgi:hypothetical protein